MTLRLLPWAQAELDDAVSWYAQQAPGLDEAFLLEALKVFRLIEQFPDAWHPLAPGIRRCRLNRFPYGVIYSRNGNELIVIAIGHLHRAPDFWEDRLPGA